MMKLMLVDDESLSRYVLISLIQKAFPTVNIVAEAENGRQAIEMNKKYQPDIIFMDIKMPGINGIDASIEILSDFPHVNIIILTAYNDFDYIKNAIDIGIKGYILKPIKESEVIEKLTKTIEQIHERASFHGYRDLVESKIQEIKPFMENELVSAFIMGNNDVEKISNYISFLQEDIRAGYFMVLSVEKSNSSEIDECIRNRLLMEKAWTIAARHLPLSKKCLMSKSHGNVIVVFVPVDPISPARKLIEESVQVAEDIHRKLKVIGNLAVAVGIGGTYADIKKFSTSYNEALYALRKMNGAIQIKHFSQFTDEVDVHKIHTYPIELENKLLDHLRCGNIENAKVYANEIIASMMKPQNGLNLLADHVCELISILRRTVLKMGVDMSVVMGSNHLSELYELTTPEAIEQWLRRNIYSVIEQVEMKVGKNQDTISRAFEIANKKFTHRISLESVAAEVGLTPQYLSKVFKDKAGINFIDYITQKRVEHAIELLKRKELNIKKISGLVGYDDANYFCKLFKKVVGVTPKQFRDKA